MNKLDLVRLGTYTQMEGSFYLRRKGQYSFQFHTKQIPGIPDLIYRLTGTSHFVDKKGRTSFSSRSIFEDLLELGFENFNVGTWNVPGFIGWDDEMFDEYLRAVIDCLGNVDVEESTPIVRVSSVNIKGMTKFASHFGTKYYTIDDRFFGYWKGQYAMGLVERLDGHFNNPRNQRGMELIKAVRWEEYL